MKKIYIAFILVYTILALQACTELKSPHYVGVIQEPMKLAENLERESIWVFNEQVYYTHIVDSTDILFSIVMWDNSKNDYVTHSSEMLLTRLGHDLFINVKNKSDSLYSIYRISGVIPEEGSIALLMVNKDSLNTLITATGINAEKYESGYTLNMSKNDLDRFIQNHVNSIFPFSSVGVIKNISGYKKKPVNRH